MAKTKCRPPRFSAKDEFRKLGNTLVRIIHRLEKIMGSQAQATQDIKDLTTRVAKIGTETAKLVELTNALPDKTSPEFDAALEALKTQVGVVDDMVPDAA